MEEYGDIYYIDDTRNAVRDHRTQAGARPGVRPSRTLVAATGYRPVYAQQAQQAPVYPQQAPVYSQQAPVYYAQQPIMVGEPGLTAGSLLGRLTIAQLIEIAAGAFAALQPLPPAPSPKDTETNEASHEPSAQLAKKQILNRHLIPFFGEQRLDAIRQEDVDRLVAKLLREKLSRKTVNNVTAVLSSLLRYAVKNKVIGPFDLSFMIKTQDTEVVAVSAADVEKLVAAAADPRYRAAILLAADAGLRVGEIRALLWSDVNELAREITVSRSIDRTNALSETKGWELRVVPISDRLWSALRALDKSKRHVISRRDGSGLALRYDGTREALLAIYKRAGVAPPSKPWHSLRHCFCTELARAGVPVNVIKELAGHQSIETTLRYMHTDRAAKRDAINALRGSHVAAATVKSS